LVKRDARLVEKFKHERSSVFEIRRAEARSYLFKIGGLTVCVREAWQVCFDRLNNQAGMDSAWEQKKLEARKTPGMCAESPVSSVRFVRLTL